MPSSAKKTTLKNGFRILTVPQSNTKAATVLVLVGTGSKYETKKMSGISHFLEHMFFKGTSRRPSPVELQELIDNVGGINNAFTSEELTGYFAKVDAKHTDLALDWVADIYQHSLLPAKEIAKEKGVVVEEINMYEDTPMRHVGDLWQNLLYGDQPAGWNIAGTKKTVSGLSRRDLVSYVNSQYVPSNTILCVAGNIDGDAVIRRARKLFGPLADKKSQGKLLVKERQQKPNVFLKYRKTGQTHIALGVRAYNLSSEHRYAQDLIATMLGGMMSSRLFVAIREKLGGAYYILTESEQNTDTGWVVSQSGLQLAKAEQAIRAILREYKSLAIKLVSEKELQKAKEHEIGTRILRLESSEEQAEFYGVQELLERRLLTPEQEYAKIRAVTPENIRDLAKDIFRPENLNLVVLGPFKNKAKFEKLLRL